MKEATEATVVAEAPKTKTGTDAGNGKPTAVDVVAKAASPRVSTVGVKYQITSGVDPNKYRGQRNIVVKALQSLQGDSDKFFTLQDIAKRCDGLISKAPVEASARWHLAALVKDGLVKTTQERPPAQAAPAS